MSTYQLTVRSHDGMWRWDLDEWSLLVAIASLSAMPETFAEWLEAVRRYQPEHRLAESAREITELGEAAGEDTWCLIDLVGQTVVAGEGFDLPGPRDAFEPSESEHVEGFPIVWMDTPAGWRLRTADEGWQNEVLERAATAAQRHWVDARAILFGTPLLEFLADNLLAVAKGDRSGDEQDELKLTREIHANWMMTPRVDLDGRTPRELLLAQQHDISFDLEHRSLQWSRQGHAPPGLSTDGKAYRYGGFGIAEIVIYFDLVRSLMTTGWKLVQSPDITRSTLIDSLAQHRDSWLSQPYEEMGMSARDLIESERRRVPVTSSGGHFDCDCPICRAEADGLFGSSPMFMCFDGHHLELEDMFAFSLEDSYAEWEEHQRMYADPEWLAGGIELPNDDGHGAKGILPRATKFEIGTDEQGFAADSVWKSSYVDWNHVSDWEPDLEHSLFALAFPLAEIIGDMKQRANGRKLVDALNEAFDTLRRSTDMIASISAARHFVDILEKVCSACPDLTPKCADLQSHLDEMLRRGPKGLRG